MLAAMAEARQLLLRRAGGEEQLAPSAAEDRGRRRVADDLQHIVLIDETSTVERNLEPVRAGRFASRGDEGRMRAVLILEVGAHVGGLRSGDRGSSPIQSAGGKPHFLPI